MSISNTNDNKCKYTSFIRVTKSNHYKNRTIIFQPFFLSLVFIDNHTIKYDIEKCTKCSFNGSKYRKLYIVLHKIVRKYIV